jgi:hypothetical protein
MEKAPVPDLRDIQIHIHEHVGPLRERVGKIEGRMETQDRELTLLRAGLDNLRDRIDSIKTAMLEALDAHTIDEIKRFEEITVTGISLTQKMDGLRNWIIAVALGAGGVLMVVEIMSGLGLIGHAG